MKAAASGSSAIVILRKLSRRLLPPALLLGVIFGPCIQAEARPNDPVKINDLTHVVISQDGRSLRLFGTSDPAGPQQAIPYLQILAASLLLPDERGPAHVRGSIPGFSLN